MRSYILEKVNNSPQFFSLGGIEVKEIDPISDQINLKTVLKSIENNFPSHYLRHLKGIEIVHLDEFDTREVNALYKDGIFYISNQQSDSQDLIDDIIHEFAHHMETISPENIYGDEALKREFLRKRKQLKFEIQTEGYWVEEYDFDQLKYNEKFDKFLYKKLGKTMLNMVTAGIFIRPYAAISLREYFATGFEAYYLGKRDKIKKISPILYEKINSLHHLENQ